MAEHCQHCAELAAIYRERYGVLRAALRFYATRGGATEHLWEYGERARKAIRETDEVDAKQEQAELNPW